MEEKKIVTEEYGDDYDEDECVYLNDYDDDEPEVPDDENDTLSFVISIFGFATVLMGVAFSIFGFIVFLKWLFSGRKSKRCANC